jgi:hypothetical protein
MSTPTAAGSPPSSFVPSSIGATVFWIAAVLVFLAWLGCLAGYLGGRFTWSPAALAFDYAWRLATLAALLDIRTRVVRR